MAEFPLNNKKKLHGLSPRANYTDRATAAFPLNIITLIVMYLQTV
jgi:hypothetical protein